MLNTPTALDSSEITFSASEEKTYVYCFVRGDIPVAQQLVQLAHAALEAGRAHPDPHRSTPSSLIAIKLKNQHELDKAFARLMQSDIACTMFFEPDWEYGNTAFATAPVRSPERHLFKRYQLWKP